jgi:hypothetical protein
MELNSDTVTVNKCAADLCTYLGDVKNFEELMPENISKFEVIRDNAFVFGLSGMPEIALELKEINSPNMVKLGAISDKIPFTLIANIKEIDGKTSEVELVFTGKFNMMMAMMVKGPVSKFIETLATNLTKV